MSGIGNHCTYEEVRNEFDHALHDSIEWMLAADLLWAWHSLAECYRLSGADPDGNEDWRLARGAVGAVKELREDYDSLTDEMYP